LFPQHLVVVSVDGLVQEDLAAIRDLPHYRSLLENGVRASRVEGIYPTQTYPLHATISTGTYPETHGIISNARFQPGQEFPEWHWYTRDNQAPTIYELAHRAGRRVCCLLWPGAAGARVDFNLPEIKPARRSLLLPSMVFSNGTPLFILNLLFRFAWMLRGLQTGRLDRFNAASAAYVLKKKRPHLLMMHLLDLDRMRHYYGSDSRQARQALRLTDDRLGTVISAVRSAGMADKTAFVVFGDHGHIDSRFCINANIALGEAGLLSLPTREKRSTGLEWKAWIGACGGSAHVYLRDRTDRRARQRLLEVLSSLKEKGSITHIFDKKQIRELHLGHTIDYVLEAKRGYYFTNRLCGNVIEPNEVKHLSSHGYLPDQEGYIPLFMAAGPGIRRGIDLSPIRMIDFAPTLAALLGLEMPTAEGRILSEMLEIA
jgi:predicted AlkP superfamily pyrophosphatase or phosphodiesterase